MEDYNFWADFFDTYQSLSDWVKILWLVVPPAFVLGLVALGLRYCLASRTKQIIAEGELVYTVRKDENDLFTVYRHNSELEDEPTTLLFHRDQAQNEETK